MRQYVLDIWDTRLFWCSLAILDVRKKYRRSLLGLGWAMLQPVVMALVLCAVFSGAFNVDFRTHFPFVLTGLCLWNYLQAIVRNGCSCIFWSETYIRQHRAPLAIYPLRIVLGAGLHLLVALCPVILLQCMFGTPPGFGSILFILFVLALLAALGWGVATLCGVINVYFPDTHQFTEIGMQILFYLTPIIYGPQILRGRNLAWLIDLNPVAAFAELIRKPILSGSLPPVWSIALAGATSFVMLFLAAVLLWKVERTIIFQL